MKLEVASLVRTFDSKKLTIHHISILHSLYSTSNTFNPNFYFILWDYLLTLTTDTNDNKIKRGVYRFDITAKILACLNLKEFPNQSINHTSMVKPQQKMEQLIAKTYFQIPETKPVQANILNTNSVSN